MKKTVDKETLDIKLMQERKTLEFGVFKDSCGNPTCFNGFDSGKFCMFLRYNEREKIEICDFVKKEVVGRDDYPFSFKPDFECPFWGKYSTQIIRDYY